MRQQDKFHFREAADGINHAVTVRLKENPYNNTAVPKLVKM
jgi:hypothetical protein